jgi:hypothetical protein
MLRTRLLSVRAFDEAAMLVDADVVEGRTVETVVDRLPRPPEVEYLHELYPLAVTSCRSRAPPFATGTARSRGR